MEGSFEDRERQFEAKFAHDEEIRFKVKSHRDKLFAAWTAGQMGAGAPARYAETLVEFAFNRIPEEIIAKVAFDLNEHSVPSSESKVRRAFEACADEARKDVIGR